MHDLEPVIAGAGFAQGRGVMLSEPVASNSPIWGSGQDWATRYPSEPWDRWTRLLSRLPFRRPDPDASYNPDPARGFWGRPCRLDRRDCLRLQQIRRSGDAELFALRLQH